MGLLQLLYVFLGILVSNTVTGCSDMLAPPLWSTISTVMGIGFTARQAIPICFFGFLICGGVIGLTRYLFSLKPRDINVTVVSVPCITFPSPSSLVSPLVCGVAFPPSWSVPSSL